MSSRLLTAIGQGVMPKSYKSQLLYELVRLNHDRALVHQINRIMQINQTYNEFLQSLLLEHQLLVSGILHDICISRQRIICTIHTTVERPIDLTLDILGNYFLEIVCVLLTPNLKTVSRTKYYDALEERIHVDPPDSSDEEAERKYLDILPPRESLEYGYDGCDDPCKPKNTNFSELNSDTQLIIALSVQASGICYFLDHKDASENGYESSLDYEGDGCIEGFVPQILLENSDVESFLEKILGSLCLQAKYYTFDYVITSDKKRIGVFFETRHD